MVNKRWMLVIQHNEAERPFVRCPNCHDRTFGPRTPSKGLWISGEEIVSVDFFD